MKVAGKYNEAIIFTKEIEQSAINQIKTLCDQVCVAGSKIRIMPDVHAGAGMILTNYYELQTYLYDNY